MLNKNWQEMPTKSGIYLLKNSKKQIIYVGKAKNLRARLRSYFAAAQTSVKLQALVRETDDFEVVLTENEVEALLLERTFIKQQKPKYNVLLRDDKDYPYLRLDWREQWPRLEKVRKRKDDGAVYFGPFGRHLNVLLALIYRLFPLIRCSRYQFKLRERPCNYYQMRMCLAPCTLPVERERYLQVLQRAVAVVQGQTQAVKKNITTAMQQAAAQEDYEEAASLRDQLQALESATQRQTVLLHPKINADVFGLALHGQQALIYLLMMRDGCLLGQDSFLLTSLLGDAKQAMSEFLLQFYEHRELPARVLLPCAVDAVLRQAIAPDGCKFNAQARGAEKELLALAQKNADFQLRQQRRDIEQELQAVKELLDLQKIPKVIECLDISNLQGTAIVAAIVCFVAGIPSKKHYRRYKISERSAKANDYDSITQVMQRRWRRAQQADDLPDLLLIDGGKGQLQAARRGIDRKAKTTLVSIAKNRKIQTSERAIESGERLFLEGRKDPVPLSPSSPAYRLIVQLRDEAHRFALAYHRHLRGKLSAQ